MLMDSDLMIYRTTLVRTFQVVTICRVDKSEVLVVLISPHDSKRDRSYDEVTVMGMNRMFIRWTRARWAGPSPSLSLLNVDLDLITHNLTQTLTLRALVAAALSSLKRPPPPPPHATRRRRLLHRKLFRPIFRGESVRADLVRPSSAG
ncbi:phosphoinositide phosphatase family protein [Dorcoceras hygrometricum]|uniref:Phosphoinositide phosphatase family protein n=1 Tax=Dorcoceras hygrometricum TaxID=472368 RepID=A0A2Z7D5G0_9LAMI|nr:phosphoinositide phosphatase family protein [Dorcoceras hygrometricum]